jgi:Flp pilus assembly protein TadD
MARARGPSRRATPDEAPPRLPSRLAPWLGLGAVLAAAVVAYRPALPGPFVLDDWGSIEGSTAIRAPGAVRIPSLPDLLGPGRPVTEVTFALDWRAAGLDPVRFHAVGLGLHLLATVLAFAWLRALLERAGHARPRAIALVVAGAFALHPIQAESVAYAAQRAEVLSSLLYLAALLLLDRAAATWPGWRSAFAWGGGVVTWVVGMGAKSIAISAPAAYVLDQAVVARPGERGAAPLLRRAGRALLLAAPILALAAWSAALHFRSFAATPGGGAGFTETSVGPGAYFLTQLRVTWLYLRLVAWPDALAFDRSFAATTSFDGPVAAAALGWVLLLGLAGWLWFRAERADGPRPAARLAAFGLLLWPVVLSPTSSFVPVADLAVEHRVYLASLGPLLAGAVGIDALLHRLLPRPRAAVAGAAAAGIVLLALAFALGARASTFGSADALWREAAAASPGNARAWTNLGLALHRRGDIAGAEAAYARAWTVVSAPGRVVSLARNHAALLLSSGRAGEALALVDRGLAIVPDDAPLRANRAAALAALGRIPEALPEARRAATLAPGDPLMRNNLGQALTLVGDWSGALAEFRAAAALDPGSPVYPASAGIALDRLQRPAEACAAFARAIALSGSRPPPLDARRRAAALGCPVEGAR